MTAATVMFLCCTTAVDAAQSTPTKDSDFVATATMNANREIVLDLRSIV